MPVGFGDLRGDYRNPMAVYRWIEANVPCFKGLINEEWTSALFNEARSRHISDSTVALALAIAKTDGYNFAGIALVSRRAGVHADQVEGACRRRHGP